jgi:predicted dehydrogenase
MIGLANDSIERLQSAINYLHNPPMQRLKALLAQAAENELEEAA